MEAMQMVNQLPIKVFLTLSYSRFAWHPDQLQRKHWRLWNSPDREIFTGGSKEPTDPGRDNLMQGSCSKLHRRFSFFGKLLWLHFVPELKNCSKKEPGFKRCQCLEAMNESNVETVKVKYETVKASSTSTFCTGMSPLWLQIRSAIKQEKLHLCSANVQTGLGEQFHPVLLPFPFRDTSCTFGACKDDKSHKEWHVLE